MATYKVLQDIEAEDKLLGPLTLKQFVFAAITIGLGFVGFLIISSPTPTFIKIPFLTVLVPPMILFGFMAAPISREQPNDIWLLARLRFLLKPHLRIWNQDGLSQLVTITAPKREVHLYTNGLSQGEVKSRLSALANTLDSRGWAVKNINTNLFAEPGYLSTGSDSDRLIGPSSLPQDVSPTDITASDDIMDENSNTTAQHLDKLVKASTQAHKQQAAEKMHLDPNDSQAPANYWFMSQTNQPQGPLPSDYAMFPSQPTVVPGSTDVHPAAEESEAEHQLAKRLTKEGKGAYERYNEHIKTIQPLHDREGHLIPKPKKPAKQSSKNPAGEGQEGVNPAILGLSRNDDLNVATIARQANRISKDDGEVVISLH